MAKFVDRKTYSQNLKTSAKYASRRTFENLMPSLSSTAINNSSLISDYKMMMSSFKRNEGVLANKKNYILGTAKDIIKNIKEDLSTGKWYNTDRDMFGDGYNTDVESNMSNILMQNVEDDDSETKADKAVFDKLARSTGIASASSSLRISDISARGSEYVGEVMTNISTNTLLAQTKFHKEQMAHLGNLEKIGMSMVKFNNTVVMDHYQKTHRFYDDVIQQLTETKDMLREIVETNDMRFGDFRKRNSISFGSNSPLNNVMTYHGGMNITNYLKNIGKNIKSGIPGIDLLGLGVSELKNQPISTILGALLSNIIPETITNKVKDIDKTLSGAFASYLFGLNKMKTSRNDFLRSIGRIFGVTADKSITPDLSVYKNQDLTIEIEQKKAKAITEVIPTYLAQIVKSMTGVDKIYDYSTGKFVDKTKRRDDLNREIKENIVSNMGDIYTELMVNMNRLTRNMDMKSTQILNDDVENFLYFLGRLDYNFDPKTTTYEWCKKRGLNLRGGKKSFDAIRAAYASMPKSAQAAVRNDQAQSIIRIRDIMEIFNENLQSSGNSAVYNDFDVPGSRAGRVRSNISSKFGRRHRINTSTSKTGTRPDELNFDMSINDMINTIRQSEDITDEEREKLVYKTSKERAKEKEESGKEGESINKAVKGVRKAIRAFFGKFIDENSLPVKFLGGVNNMIYDILYGPENNNGTGIVGHIYNTITEYLQKGLNVAKKALFGETDKDGNLTGGFIPKEAANILKKYVPKGLKGAAAGAVAGLIVKNPLIGAVVGASLNILSGTDIVAKFLWGDEKDPNSGKGVLGGIKKEIKDKLGKAFSPLTSAIKDIFNDKTQKAKTWVSEKTNILASEIYKTMGFEDSEEPVETSTKKKNKFKFSRATSSIVPGENVTNVKLVGITDIARSRIPNYTRILNKIYEALTGNPVGGAGEDIGRRSIGFMSNDFGPTASLGGDIRGKFTALGTGISRRFGNIRNKFGKKRKIGFTAEGYDTTSGAEFTTEDNAGISTAQDVINEYAKSESETASTDKQKASAFDLLKNFFKRFGENSSSGIYGAAVSSILGLGPIPGFIIGKLYSKTKDSKKSKEGESVEDAEKKTSKIEEGIEKIKSIPKKKWSVVGGAAISTMLGLGPIPGALVSMIYNKTFYDEKAQKKAKEGEDNKASEEIQKKIDFATKLRHAGPMALGALTSQMLGLGPVPGLIVGGIYNKYKDKKNAEQKKDENGNVIKEKTSLLEKFKKGISLAGDTTKGAIVSSLLGLGPVPGIIVGGIYNKFKKPKELSKEEKEARESEKGFDKFKRKLSHLGMMGASAIISSALGLGPIPGLIMGSVINKVNDKKYFDNLVNKTKAASSNGTTTTEKANRAAKKKRLIRKMTKNAADGKAAANVDILSSEVASMNNEEDIEDFKFVADTADNLSSIAAGEGGLGRGTEAEKKGVLLDKLAELFTGKSGNSKLSRNLAIAGGLVGAAEIAKGYLNIRTGTEQLRAGDGLSDSDEGSARIGRGITNTVSGGFKVTGLLAKVAQFIAKAIKSLAKSKLFQKFLGTKVMTKVLSFASKIGGTAVAKVAGTVATRLTGFLAKWGQPIGWAITIAQFAYDCYSGYNDTKNIMQTSAGYEASTSLKWSCALAKGISGLLLGLINVKWLATNIYNLIGNETDKAELYDDQKKTVQEYNKFVAENNLNPTDFTMAEYQNATNKTTWQKIKSAFTGKTYGLEEYTKSNLVYDSSTNNNIIINNATTAGEGGRGNASSVIKQVMSDLRSGIYSSNIKKVNSTSATKSNQNIFTKFGSWIKSLFKKGSGRGEDADYYSQKDSRWAGKSFGKYRGSSDTIGYGGCGPTVAAMMLQKLTGQQVTPDIMADLALKSGYKYDGGTDAEFFKFVGNVLGIPMKTKSGISKDAIASLMAGRPVALLGKDVDGTSPYGSGSHYVLGTGMDKSGNVSILDPQNKNNNRKYNIKDLYKNTYQSITTGRGDEATGNLWNQLVGKFNTAFTSEKYNSIFSMFDSMMGSSAVGDNSTSSTYLVNNTTSSKPATASTTTSATASKNYASAISGFTPTYNYKIGEFDNSKYKTLKDALIAKTRQLVFAHESGGDYAAVLADDNGSGYSVGVIGWHNTNARDMFNNLADALTDPADKAKAKHYADIYYRALTPVEAQEMKAFLNSPRVKPVNKQVQDTMLATYWIPNVIMKTPLEMYEKGELLDARSIPLLASIGNSGFAHINKWRQKYLSSPNKAKTKEEELDAVYKSLMSSDSYWGQAYLDGKKYSSGWLSIITNDYNDLKNWDVSQWGAGGRGNGRVSGPMIPDRLKRTGRERLNAAIESPRTQFNKVKATLNSKLKNNIAANTSKVLDTVYNSGNGRGVDDATAVMITVLKNIADTLLRIEKTNAQIADKEFTANVVTPVNTGATGGASFRGSTNNKREMYNKILQG